MVIFPTNIWVHFQNVRSFLEYKSWPEDYYSVYLRIASSKFCFPCYHSLFTDGGCLILIGTHFVAAVRNAHNRWYFILFLQKKKKKDVVTLSCTHVVMHVSSKQSLCHKLTSLSSSWTRVTFPDLGSTLKYSLEPFSKVRAYRTESPSGSVPLRVYMCVPTLTNK